METFLGTLFWSFTDPFIAFMGVMAGVLRIDRKTRFGAAFLIAVLYEIILVFIVGARQFDLNLFAMNIIAAFVWAVIGGFAADWIRKRRSG